MAYSIPDYCPVCRETLSGSTAALVLVQIDVQNNVQGYHKSCVERLTHALQLLNMQGPFYGASGNASGGSGAEEKASMNATSDVNDAYSQVMKKTGYQNTPRTPYVSEFDDRRDSIISELRMKLAALEKTIADGPAYIAQAVRMALTEAMIEYRSGKMHFDEGKGEWTTRQ